MFGKTDALGAVANDPGMGGTAISSHAVVLKNLVPNTTYRYRLTATDARGRVFQTRAPLTFTTPPARAKVAARPDIARGAALVAVSSESCASSPAASGDPVGVASLPPAPAHGSRQLNLGQLQMGRIGVPPIPVGRVR